VIVEDAVPPAGGVTSTRSPPYAVVVRHRSVVYGWKIEATARPAPSYAVRVWLGTSCRSVAVDRVVLGAPAA